MRAYYISDIKFLSWISVENAKVAKPDINMDTVTSTQFCFNSGPTSQMLAQNWNNTGQITAFGWMAVFRRIVQISLTLSWTSVYIYLVPRPPPSHWWRQSKGTYYLHGVDLYGRRETRDWKARARESVQTTAVGDPGGGIVIIYINHMRFHQSNLILKYTRDVTLPALDTATSHVK